MNRADVGVALAHLIEPEAWAEYDTGKGTATNEAAWRISDSIVVVKRLLPVMERLGTLEQIMEAIESGSPEGSV